MRLILYSKVPKVWDARNLCFNLKFKQKGQTLRVFCQNGANRIANSEDPDQTAPLGSALFGQTYLSKNLGSLRYSRFRDAVTC